jgi:hypothetical protein
MASDSCYRPCSLAGAVAIALAPHAYRSPLCGKDCIKKSGLINPYPSFQDSDWPLFVVGLHAQSLLIPRSRALTGPCL